MKIRHLVDAGKTNPKRTQYEPKRTQSKPICRMLKMNVTTFLTKAYENKSNWAICENKPNQTQSEILNQKSQIHSHPAGNKLHTPRRQSWGCFDLSGRATPKTAGLGFSLVALELILIPIYREGQGGRPKMLGGVVFSTLRTPTCRGRHRALQPAAIERVIGIGS